MLLNDNWLCNNCGKSKQAFTTECEKVLCERCFVLHDNCGICESKGYSFNARMAIVGFCKVYKLKITTPYNTGMINMDNSCDKKEAK